MSERAVLAQGGKVGLEGIVEEFVPMFAQEDEELGPLDEPQDGMFDRGRIDGWVPQGRTNGQAAFLTGDAPSTEQITPTASTTLLTTWPVF